MSLKVREKKEPRSASFSASGYTKHRIFIVEGGDITNPEDAILADDGTNRIPALGEEFEEFGMVVADIRADSFEDDDTRWIVRVNYENTNEDQTQGGGSSSLSFDTGGATVHRVQAETPTPAPLSFARPGKQAPLSKGLIGWDGKIAQGVDIESGAFQITIAKRHTIAEITTQYLLDLSRNAFKVNSQDWAFWKGGEVLYRGAQGRHTGGGRAFTKGDDASQIAGVDKITGVSSLNSDNGLLYLNLTKLRRTREHSIALYKDADQLEKVAEAPIAEIGIVELASVEGSGIGGTLRLDHFQFDTKSIIISFPFPWEINYAFAISENKLTDFTIGDITVNSKLGWDYMDVQYVAEKQTVGDPAVTRIVQTANFVYLHEVYPFISLSFLLIDDTKIIPGQVVIE